MDALISSARQFEMDTYTCEYICSYPMLASNMVTIGEYNAPTDSQIYLHEFPFYIPHKSIKPYSQCTLSYDQFGSDSFTKLGHLYSDVVYVVVPNNTEVTHLHDIFNASLFSMRTDPAYSAALLQIFMMLVKLYADVINPIIATTITEVS